MTKTASSKPLPTEQDLANMADLLSNGKRHHVCKEPQQALDCFVQLCEKLAEFYGQLAEECMEGYLWYAKALLEMARVENDVLGNAVKDAPVLGKKDEEEPEEPEEGEGEEKRAELRANVEHAMRDGNLYNETDTEEEGEAEAKDVTEGEVSSSSTAAEGSKEAETTTNTADKSETDKTEKREANEENKSENAEADKATDETTEEEEGGEVEGENIDDEEVTNMQLSWEMFELCAVICTEIIKKNEKRVEEAKSFLAESKYGLAQISLESEQYESSIADFTVCLGLYKEILENENNRKIAEIYYNIGLAYSFDKKFLEAIEQYKLAVTCLEKRVKELEEKIEKAAGGKEKMPMEMEEWKKEASELKDLVLLDLMAKIEDATESKKQGDASIAAMKQAAKEMFSAVSDSGFDKGFGFDEGEGFDSGFEKPLSEKPAIVQDISNKIRSTKRKTDSDEAPADASKKLCLQTVSSTSEDKKQNGAVNGTNSHAVEQNMES